MPLSNFDITSDKLWKMGSFFLFVCGFSTKSLFEEIGVSLHTLASRQCVSVSQLLLFYFYMTHCLLNLSQSKLSFLAATLHFPPIFMIKMKDVSNPSLLDGSPALYNLGVELSSAFMLSCALVNSDATFGVLQVAREWHQHFCCFFNQCSSITFFCVVFPRLKFGGAHILELRQITTSNAVKW